MFSCKIRPKMYFCVFCNYIEVFVPFLKCLLPDFFVFKFALLNLALQKNRILNGCSFFLKEMGKRKKRKSNKDRCCYGLIRS